jgi:4-carboxymuconolactone decarboxylase
MPPVDTLNNVQRRVYDATVQALGAPIGPRMVLMNHPEVVEAWSALADVLKRAAYPKSVRELVILLVARHWKAAFEWYAHEPQALKSGLAQDTIDTLRLGGRPAALPDAMHEAVYEYVTELQETHQVSDGTYGRVRRALGDRGLIEMSVLMGHYTNVAMTLITHQVPMPEGQSVSFG